MIDQNHYALLGIEPIDIMKLNMSKEQYKGFLIGNIVKYSHRKKEQDLNDAKKIQIYARWLELELDSSQVDEGRALDSLITQIPHIYNVIVSSGRGGAAIAAQVAYAKGLPLFISDNFIDFNIFESPLFIDDIEDTSNTVEKAKSLGIDVGVLVQKTLSKLKAEYVGIQVDTSEYINFTFQSKDNQ